jgi:hypothetical protein
MNVAQAVESWRNSTPDQPSEIDLELVSMNADRPFKREWAMVLWVLIGAL